jgi:hypothetical protein
MTAGYRIAAGTDLDNLFVARVSTAVANVGYLAGGSDLSTRYEPRAATTAIANTGYRNSSGTDLAQIFMSRTATFPATCGAMQNGSNYGYSDNSIIAVGAMPGSTYSPKAIMAWNVASILFRTPGISCDVGLFGTSTPVNSDATWKTLEMTGVFSDSGSTVTKTFTRSGSSYTSAATYAYWTIAGLSWRMVPSNSYNCVFKL